MCVCVLCDLYELCELCECVSVCVCVCVCVCELCVCVCVCVYCVNSTGHLIFSGAADSAEKSSLLLEKLLMKYSHLSSLLTSLLSSLSPPHTLTQLSPHTLSAQFSEEPHVQELSGFYVNTATSQTVRGSVPFRTFPNVHTPIPGGTSRGVVPRQWSSPGCYW